MVNPATDNKLTKNKRPFDCAFSDVTMKALRLAFQTNLYTLFIISSHSNRQLIYAGCNQFLFENLY